MTTVPHSHRDLLDAQVATLATVGGDDRPQLSEVWFLAEHDTDKAGAKYQADLRERDQPGDSLVIVTLRPTRVRVWR